MTGKRFQILLSFIFVLILSLPLVAQAQYDEYGVPYSNKYYQRSPARIAMALMRHPTLDDGFFILHLTASDNAYGGCIKFSELPYDISFKDIYMDLTVEAYTVDMRDSGQGPHYNCPEHAKAPTASVVLSKDLLRQNNVQRIRLKTVGGLTQYYDLELGDHRVRLRPSEDIASVAMVYKRQNVHNVVDPLNLWFYPEDTYMLYAPSAPQDADIRPAIDEFATARGCVPLQAVYPDFKSPLAHARFYYYVCKNAPIGENAGIQEGFQVGSVKIGETVYGLQGDRIEVKDIPVYAKVPGTYE